MTDEQYAKLQRLKAEFSGFTWRFRRDRVFTGSSEDAEIVVTPLSAHVESEGLILELFVHEGNDYVEALRDLFDVLEAWKKARSKRQGLT